MRPPMLPASRRFFLHVSAALLASQPALPPFPAHADTRALQLQRFAVDSALGDSKHYRALLLPNGLRVLLASDNLATKSAASLTVGVGSMSNPPAWPGLAHFVEHMLFLGTDRFREGEFEQFIGVNGGTNNAYTETEDTTYFFDVIASSLPGALDRFSDFFVSPLFTESATGREVSAIESEHQKNVPLDSRRLDMLLRIRAHPSHPYSRFTTGNRQTLRDGDGNARAALLDFYRDYYTAPQMSLSLTGPQSLDELQRLAVSRFGRVGGGAPTSLPASISYDGLPPPFAPGSTTALQAVPVRDVRSLTLTWCVPIDGFDFREWVQTKPEQLLVNLLSSRVAGTPWQFLKRNGFASNVEARVEELTRSFVLVSVYAGLTEQGLAQWDDVATIVFSYLRALRDGVPSHWFSEARAISRLAFEYAEPATPRAFVTATSGNLPLYPPREWLTGPAVIAPGAERALAYLIDSMRPTTLAATTLVSKAYASRAKLIEPIYGTKYVEIDIAPQVAAWEAAPNIAELHAPNPNPFIPTRLGIKAAPRQPRLAPSAAGLRDGETHPSPTLLTERPGLRLFHLQDSYFRRPKAFAFFALRSPALYTSPAVSVQAEIYQSLLTDVLQDTTFQASQAGLTVSTSVGWRGLDVFLGGYDQNLPRLASLVASTLRTVPLEPSAFESAREKLGRQLANLDQRGSYELVRYRRSLALEAPRYANSELAAAAKLVTLDDLKAFQSGLLSKMEAEAFITGNVRDEEAAAIVQQLHEALPSQPLPQEERPTRRVRRLPLGKTLQQFVTPSTTEGNSAIEVYYQIGQDDGDRWVVLSLLAQLMNKPFYASLRTRQQLGYIVQCGTNELFGVRALTFTVQSATASPQLVEERIDEFVRGFRRSLLAVGDEEVASLGERLSKQYLDVDARLDSQAGRLWTECLTQRYDFERPWELSTKARRITPAALLDFYDTYIADDGSQMRCLSTHVFSRAMAPPRTQLRQPRVPDVFYDPSVDLLATRNVRRAAAHSTATEASDAAAASGTSRSASAAASPSRARPLVMRMATPTRRAQARRVAAPVMVDAAQVWSAYEVRLASIPTFALSATLAAACVLAHTACI